MNTVVDEVLAGSPRYTIKDNGGTTLYDNVQIDLKTQVTTAGTPLNKALFDSIRDDLNTRLLISNKANQGEAEAGTNDTKYMTPLKTRQVLNYLTTTKNIATGNVTETIYDFSSVTNKIIRIEGCFDAPYWSGNNYPSLKINGSQIVGCNESTGTWSYQSSTMTYPVRIDYGSSNTARCPFYFEFNLITNTFRGHIFEYTSLGGYKNYNVSGYFTSLTSLTAFKLSTTPMTVTITEIV